MSNNDGMKFSALVLGVSSASPTKDKHTTSQLITHHNSLFLVDCGEGAQFQLRHNKVSIQKIERIFISHLHGDHYLGLPGLLFTMDLLGRQKDLHIYCPPMIKEIFEVNLKASGAKIKFKIFYHFTKDDQLNLLFEDDKISVYSFPLKHRITCTGFLFKEKPKPRKINKSETDKYNVPVYFMSRLKAGEDFKTLDGKIIKNKLLTTESTPPLSYAFCSDTAYFENIIPYIKNVNLLYHEATFSEEFRERAKETYHSTAKDAATIAQKSGVRKLLIGHFSNRFKTPTVLEKEAQEIFKNTEAAEENNTYLIE